MPMSSVSCCSHVARSLSDNAATCGVQIEYDGVKEYRSHSGIDTKFIFPKAAPKIVATDERMLFVDGLVPRTVYTFNISAYFTDDTWGPVHPIRVETSIGGVFLSWRFYQWKSTAVFSFIKPTFIFFIVVFATLYLLKK